MPFIQVKVFENELNLEQTENLIHKITDVVAEVTNEKLRDVTWVTIEEISGSY